MHGEQRVRPPCKKPSSSDRIGDPLGRDQPLVAEYASRLQEGATPYFVVERISTHPLSCLILACGRFERMMCVTLLVG